MEKLIDIKSIDKIPQTYIYGLKCPIDNQIRYIGKSDYPQKRYVAHLGLCKADVDTHKKNWIKKVLKANQKPKLIILETVDIDKWEDAEISWIKKGRTNGWKLTNKTDGGANNYKGTSDIVFNCIDALSLYLPQGFSEKISAIPFEILATIANKAAKKSMAAFFGLGQPRDSKQADIIKEKIINSEINLYLRSCKSC